MQHVTLQRVLLRVYLYLLIFRCYAIYYEIFFVYCMSARSSELLFEMGHYFLGHFPDNIIPTICLLSFPKIYRKSVLHLKYRFAVYLSSYVVQICSTFQDTQYLVQSFTIRPRIRTEKARYRPKNVFLGENNEIIMGLKFDGCMLRTHK